MIVMISENQTSSVRRLREHRPDIFKEMEFERLRSEIKSDVSIAYKNFVNDIEVNLQENIRKF